MIPSRFPKTSFFDQKKDDYEINYVFPSNVDYRDTTRLANHNICYSTKFQIYSFWSFFCPTPSLYIFLLARSSSFLANADMKFFFFPVLVNPGPAAGDEAYCCWRPASTSAADGLLRFLVGLAGAMEGSEGLLRFLLWLSSFCAVVLGSSWSFGEDLEGRLDGGGLLGLFFGLRGFVLGGRGPKVSDRAPPMPSTSILLSLRRGGAEPVERMRRTRSPFFPSIGYSIKSPCALSALSKALLSSAS